MLQKEVAERLASPPGNKSYGILSVLLQAWYHIEYLFTVDENSFIPPPKVKSAVIRIKRNTRTSLGCDEVLFKSVIKTTFNQRRKTIRNSIKPIAGGAELPDDILFTKRPEQLSVEQFVELTNLLEKSLKKGSGSKGL
jgi:16S rRNA (adenine1518-N6/adenine1519-N6)-dimethyltransferase